MISCLLLCAGFSVRFKSPKALATINKETIIKRLQNLLIQSRIGEVIIVLGDHLDDLKLHLLKHKKLKVVYNKDYNLGQTSSFQAGVKEISSEACGLMLLPVDVPAIQLKTINDLVDHFLSIKPKILIPTYHNRKGHPPIFSVSYGDDFLKMDTSVGLNQFEHQHASDIELFPVEDPGIVWSFNTPEEFDKLKIYFKFSS